MSSTSPVEVRRIVETDAEQLAEFGRRNRAFHGDDFVVTLDVAGWHGIAADPAQRWYRVDAEGSGLVGVMCLVRWSGRPWRTADLGAGADELAAGRGILAKGLRRLLELEMVSGNLERVEALIRPGHTVSERFVAAARLRPEGLARAAISRDGKRLDMNRWAVVRSDLVYSKSPGPR